MLITLEPEMVEWLLSSRPRSGTSPTAMTHHNLDLSIHFPFIIPLSPVSPPSLVLIPSTLDPRCADTIVPPYSPPESNCSSPGQVFFRPLSIHYPLLPHSPLSLSARTVSHAIVSDFGCTARLVCHHAQPPPMFSFIPHSYALYPDDSHTICDSSIMLPLRYWLPPFPIVTVTSLLYQYIGQRSIACIL